MMAGKRRRPSMGRQKIEIKRIEKEEARQVCFSKRRSGVFKKASEISIMCGAEVAVVVFSPAGKPFSFGHPSVNSVLDRYLCGIAGPAAPSAALAQAQPPGGDQLLVRGLTGQHAELTAKLEGLRRRREQIEAATRMGELAQPFSLDRHLEELGVADAEMYLAALERLRRYAMQWSEQLMRQAQARSQAQAQSQQVQAQAQALAQAQSLGYNFFTSAAAAAPAPPGVGASLNNGMEGAMMQVGGMNMMQAPPRFAYERDATGFSFDGF